MYEYVVNGGGEVASARLRRDVRRIRCLLVFTAAAVLGLAVALAASAALAYRQIFP